MLETLNNICLLITDPVLSWLLWLPKDLAIFIVAVTTSAIITFSRKGVTNQEWLKRAEEDVKRQDELAKEAKKRGDKETVRRHKMNVGLIKMRGFRYEGIPLLIAIIPIALLATWCFNRLGFYPPADKETVEIKVYFPRSAMESTIYMIPEDGIGVENGYVRKIVEDRVPPSVTPWDKGVDKIVAGYNKGWEWVVTKVLHAAVPPPQPLGGLAAWKIKAGAGPQPYVLQFVHNGKIYKKEFLVGARKYSTQADVFDPTAPVQAIEQVLRPFMFLRYIGGFGPFVPPWLVAYLLIAIPFVTVLKRVFKIY